MPAGGRGAHVQVSPPAGGGAPWQRGGAPPTAGVATGGEEPRARKGVCALTSVCLRACAPVPAGFVVTPRCACVCLSVRPPARPSVRLSVPVLCVYGLMFQISPTTLGLVLPHAHRRIHKQTGRARAHTRTTDSSFSRCIVA